MTALAFVALAVGLGGAPLPSWSFVTDTQGWVANTHLSNVEVKNGRLSADATDWDPSFSKKDLAIEATPWQYVVICLKADKSGQGELFWSGETEGQYGGLSQDKRTPFEIVGNNRIHDIIVFPFWHPEGVIRQLRLDLFNGAHFEITSIRIESWGKDAAPKTDAFAWNFNGDTAAWQIFPRSADLFSPPLNLAVKDKNWVTVVAKANQDDTARLLWSTMDVRGVQSADFEIRSGPEARTYNIEMTGRPSWHDGIATLGISAPKETLFRLDSVTVTDKPSGPPELVVDYFGFADAIPRTSVPCRVIAQVTNKGAVKSEPAKARLVLAPDMRLFDSPIERDVPALDYGATHTLEWRVSTEIPGSQKLLMSVGDKVLQETTLTFTKTLLMPREKYVPKPVPVRSEYDICAYYFPGWNADAKWDCIRRVAPNRKPALGYYDEGNPECVDWQIKWAVENCISCFLVDWYWVDGQQSLTQWFDAYRKAKYRDMLKVAIMWANHNPPNTHSPEDWRNVTQHWIDNYFNLPAYYRIDGKPAVFIWAPSLVRTDLKGSEAVKQCMAESQEMAKKAGFNGITFVAMNSQCAKSEVETLLGEGYNGITTYHEWGTEYSGSMKKMQYESVFKHAPENWEAKNASAGPLTYYPVVDTGWDSRPWHGDKAFQIVGRTPEAFVQLLQRAVDFSMKKNNKIIILGPLNEWGEGSYIEPCVEFGFSMYEAVRSVFGLGNPRRWPVNFGPSNVGLGPYDFPIRPPVNAWTFAGPKSDWSPMMGVSELACADGLLHFKTSTDDPAIVVETYGLDAAKFASLTLEMQITGPLPPKAAGQLFWSVNGTNTSEDASVSFPLAQDGQMHLYKLDLKANPRWRNRITTLRLDPAGTKNLQVAIKEIKLLP